MARTPYWLIQGGVLIDWLAIPVVAIFCYGLYKHWQKINSGDIILRLSRGQIRRMWQYIKWSSLIKNGLLGLRLFRKPVTGFAHGMIFGGMVLLFGGTAMVLLNVLFGLPVFTGGFNRWCMAFALDAAGLAISLGVVFLLVRRLSGYRRLVTPNPRPGFIGVEALLLAIIWTGFGLEALRIHIAGQPGAGEYAFIGGALAGLLGAIPGDTMNTMPYIALWWCHGLLALGFIAYIPFSPLTHLLFIPVNAALQEPNMGADDTMIDASVLEVTDEEPMPALGTPTLADYSAKRRLDAGTCLWCGRCQEVCPASLTEKNLSPKGVVTTLAQWLQDQKFNDDGLIDAVGMSTLFECRTCGACVEACPAMINPLKAIMGMRQSLMMERGEMPAPMLQAYRNIETFMHPFTSSASASDWRRGLDVPRFKAGQSEYLLWIGCAVTYEDRAQQIGRAMVEILNRAGISYGIIEEARCTGDPAKQMGDDFLFTTLAGANIQLFADHQVQKIITLCPHCFNSFRTYYPPLGGHYQVIPHAEFIDELIRSGKIELKNGGQSLTYHDPCYLGRHNRLFSGPRHILNTLGQVKELPRREGNSFCCGAGGGQLLE